MDEEVFSSLFPALSAARLSRVRSSWMTTASYPRKRAIVLLAGSSFLLVSYFDTDDKRCLYDINLPIENGQTIGTLGPTGSTKTNLVQLIARLYELFSGPVKVVAIDVRGEPTVGKQKGHGRGMPDPHGTGRFERIRRAKTEALHCSPKILILDDSSSAVDTKTDETAKLCSHVRLHEVDSAYNADKLVLQNITIAKDQLRQSLGVVLHDVHLFSRTVMENIRCGRLDATD